MNKNLGKTTKKSIYDEYRKSLEMPNLTDKEVEAVRYNVKLIAQTICEYAWKKKFH